MDRPSQSVITGALMPQLFRSRSPFWTALVLLLVSTVSARAVFAEDNEPRPAAYRSPYSVNFTVPQTELIHDLLHGERGDYRNEAEIPHADWYSHKTRERWNSWGPPARTYPVPEGLERRSAEWKRERVIAVGLRFVGYEYQHHHIPDWNPPANWPWKHTAIGHNGKGVDCSNFTGFVYNVGFGVRLNTDVHHQSEHRQAPIPTLRREAALQRIELPADYAERRNVLETGDLLFIRNGAGEHISHVVLWVGRIGTSRDDAPLVLDSHGEGVKDSEGQSIPSGIQLRPFHERSWYNHQASHALRVFHAEER